MKIMTAMYTIKRGGSYDRFIMMIKAFLKRSFEVYCISLTPIDINHPYFKNYIIHYPFKNKDKIMAKVMISFLFPFLSMWVGWRNKIDLIISFGFLYTFILGFSKLVIKKPIITFIRGNFIFGLKAQKLPRILLYLEKVIEYLGTIISEKIVTNNISKKEEILKLIKMKKSISIDVLYNNIPPINISKTENKYQIKTKYGIPSDSRVLVTAGIINRGKNLKILIKSLSKIGLEDIYLLIIGDCSTALDFNYKKELMRLVRDLEVQNQVIFTGWVEKEDLWKIYIVSDLFILTSKSEGMPNSMLEALGLDLPCMGSDIPGIRDILKHKELIFDPMDEEILSKKLRLFFSDNQFSNRVKKLCQERKERFSFDWEERLLQIVFKGFNQGKN